ncbi:MAG: class I SAM-dependent methyltransferase [Patescibacteria group bacterium]
MLKTAPKKPKKKADQYNDPKHNYLEYWDGRDYEHAAEEMAIKRLLRGRHFKNAADIGGGYGRLCLLLQKYADSVTLAEPSQQQLDIAKEFLKDNPKIKQKLTQADDLKFKDNELKLITMIRVMHHLPDPIKEFEEIARVLADDGVFILELANNAHARNRIKYSFRGRRIPQQPVDIRSKANKHDNEIAFVNHNPKTVVKQLAHAGLRVDKVLSVSNLRSPVLKKVIPKGVMLKAEWLMQSAFSKIHFGPSVFFLVKKAK